MNEWTPYRETLTDILSPLGLNPLKTYRDIDLAPADELQSDTVSGRCTAYATDKLEKIGLGSFVADGSVHYGLCVAVPAPRFDLPMFVSRWRETDQDITMLVDSMPSVDSLVHEEYRLRYVETLGDLWDKFSHLPGICPEENDAMRSVCSIIYTAAQVPISNDGMRQAALAPHSAYLKRYASFVESAEPVTDDAIVQECERKRSAIRSVLSASLLDGLDTTAGHEIASLLRTVFY